MIPALTIAVAGLVDATNRVNNAASNIVQRPAKDAKFSAQVASAYGQPAGAGASEPSSGDPSSGATAQLSTASVAAGAPRYVPSLAEDIVMMREAVHAYKANAKVIRTLDDVTRELIDVIGRPGRREHSA